jgi:hypothetical protein
MEIISSVKDIASSMGKKMLQKFHHLNGKCLSPTSKKANSIGSDGNYSKKHSAGRYQEAT